MRRITDLNEYRRSGGASALALEDVTISGKILARLVLVTLSSDALFGKNFTHHHPSSSTVTIRNASRLESSHHQEADSEHKVTSNQSTVGSNHCSSTFTAFCRINLATYVTQPLPPQNGTLIARSPLLCL